RGVHVKVAANVGLGYEAWQGACFSRLNLTAVLAELGFHVAQPQRLIDAFLRLAGHAAVVSHSKQPVLIQPVSVLNRPGPEDDVVGFGGGEVLHGGSAALQRHESKIRLVAATESNARFGVPL